MFSRFQSSQLMMVAMTLLASACFGQEQGTCFPAQVPPDGLKYPDWLKPGTRITYYMGSCALNSVKTILQPDPNAPPDPNGNGWRNAAGQKFNPVELPNSGGAGF